MDPDYAAEHHALESHRNVKPKLTQAPQCTAQAAAAADDFNYPLPPGFGHIFLRKDDFDIDSAPQLARLSRLSDIRPTTTPTQPAALTAAGAQLAMSASMSSSSTSLADSNYDMLDDASEFSNDDRETASLPSEQHDESDEGAMTPEDSGSVVDVEEEHADDIDDSEPTAVPEGSFETLPGGQQLEEEDIKENALLDSYELETPRQSVMHRGGAPLLSDSYTTTSTDTDRITFNVLFVSKHASSEETETMVALSKKLAASLSTSAAPANQLEFQVLTTPLPTATSNNAPSVLLVRFREVEILVQHCTRAEEQATPTASYHLVLEGLDRKRYTYVYGTGQKIPNPDLAVIHLGTSDAPHWFTIVKKAMACDYVPVVVLEGNRRGFGPRSQQEVEEAKEGSHLFLNNTIEVGGKTVQREIRNLLKSKLPFRKELETEAPASANTQGIKAFNPFAYFSTTPWDFRALFGLVAMLAFLQITGHFWPALNAPLYAEESLDSRRDALSSALTPIDTSASFNISHLLPSSAVLQGMYEGFTSEARSQGAAPNHIIISLPKPLNGRHYLQPYDIAVYKAAGRGIDFNLTQLIDGVYDVTVDPVEAYGQVTVNMLVKKAPLNITTSHTFGKRPIHRTTTAMAKTLTKDISVARQRLQGLKQKFGVELSAGAAATTNVTSEIALYAVRDVQAYVNTAATAFGKVYNSTQDISTRFRSTLHRSSHNAAVDVQTGVQQAKHNAQLSLTAVKDLISYPFPSKKSLHDGLVASRTKALGLKQRLSGARKEFAKSTSAGKELSLRLQNLWSPTEKTKRAGSLKEIAQCVGKEDYVKCRREQRVADAAKKAVQLHTDAGVGKAVTADPLPTGKSSATPSTSLYSSRTSTRSSRVSQGSEKSTAKPNKAAAKAEAKAKREEEKARKKAAREAAKAAKAEAAFRAERERAVDAGEKEIEAHDRFWAELQREREREAAMDRRIREERAAKAAMAKAEAGEEVEQGKGEGREGKKAR
ncbi:uncharacterized protein LTR77_007390 [Saxophila tyrrhenica]|uniref:Uncharacterized protein n=1 Tax=Saxophila tyrrhenica TaxID=1690608 RepID=A0AAV9P6I1_9PEZI|nr:hypothetical protein LTR77_007390 [Saxophila tyrrhenica]